MPEGMGVNVWESVPLAELLEIVSHAVRVHGLAVVLREYEVLILVVLPQPQPFLRLPCPIPPEQLHCLSRQCDVSPGSFRFGRTLIDADIWGVKDAIANINPVPLKVHLVPFQPQHLPRRAPVIRSR